MYIYMTSSNYFSAPAKIFGYKLSGNQRMVIFLARLFAALRIDVRLLAFFFTSNKLTKVSTSPSNPPLSPPPSTHTHTIFNLTYLSVQFLQKVKARQK